MNQLLKPRHILITGGSRSGKSLFAEEQARLMGGRVVYLATAESRDSEMRERIIKHQQRRPVGWLTVESPLQVPEVLSNYQTGYTVILDCLTMYMSNLYFKYEQSVDLQQLFPEIQRELVRLVESVNSSKANLLIVTNEVGWGIVPENPLARTFRDLAGLANQQIAAVCDEVFLVVSGIPVKIKGVANV